jgi:hypothetical protein
LHLCGAHRDAAVHFARARVRVCVFMSGVYSRTHEFIRVRACARACVRARVHVHYTQRMCMCSCARMRVPAQANALLPVRVACACTFECILRVRGVCPSPRTYTRHTAHAPQAILAPFLQREMKFEGTLSFTENFGFPEKFSRKSSLFKGEHPPQSQGRAGSVSTASGSIPRQCDILRFRPCLLRRDRIRRVHCNSSWLRPVP